MDLYDKRPGDVFDVTLSLDTGIFASGDVIADTQACSNIMPVAGGAALLQSVILLDEDDVGTAIDLLFFSSVVVLGTENAVPSISDANCRQYLGKVAVAAADFADLGGVKVAEIKGINMLLRAADGSRDIGVAAVCRSGTPTYSAAGVKLRLGLVF